MVIVQKGTCQISKTEPFCEPAIISEGNYFVCTHLKVTTRRSSVPIGLRNAVVL